MNKTSVEDGLVVARENEGLNASNGRRTNEKTVAVKDS